MNRKRKNVIGLKLESEPLHVIFVNSIYKNVNVYCLIYSFFNSILSRILSFFANYIPTINCIIIQAYYYVQLFIQAAVDTFYNIISINRDCHCSNFFDSKRILFIAINNEILLHRSNLYRCFLLNKIRNTTKYTILYNIIIFHRILYDNIIQGVYHRGDLTKPYYFFIFIFFF